MKTNDELIDYLVSEGHIRSSRIEKAFREVDRADFIEQNSYQDRPLNLEKDSTISAPHIVAQMLELLEPRGRVLEMGSGSGYVLALLSHLCDEVVGVERIESLVMESQKRVPAANILLDDQVPPEKFDRVLYSFATAEENIEEALNKTDAEILVAPVQEEERQILRKYTSEGVQTGGYVRFVPRREGVRKS